MSIYPYFVIVFQQKDLAHSFHAPLPLEIVSLIRFCREPGLTTSQRTGGTTGAGPLPPGCTSAGCRRRAAKS